MEAGKVKVFVGLGGNFSAATPDTLSHLGSDALVRPHGAHRHQAQSQPPVHGKDALILPTLGRTEIDNREGVAQGITVEDSVSMVHISYGINKPASPNLRSETAIVARMANATLGDKPVPWLCVRRGLCAHP
jgi:hypothetical protein